MKKHSPQWKFPKSCYNCKCDSSSYEEIITKGKYKTDTGIIRYTVKKWKCNKCDDIFLSPQQALNATKNLMYALK